MNPIRGPATTTGHNASPAAVERAIGRQCGCRERHDEALDEYRRGAKWYEGKREGWGDVYIVAYAHERRRSGYWKHGVGG